MIDLIAAEKQFLLPHIYTGGTAADFTMGSGHDTLWLSNAVGAEGRVYAFDIQQEAVDRTAELLREKAQYDNYTLIHDSHHRAAEYIHEKICAGMFNLGWLPGTDHSVTTKRETTLAAVKSAIDILEDGGALQIAVYPGHEEGRLEGEMLDRFLAEIDKKKLCVSKLRIINVQASPYFFLIEKK